MQKYRIKQVGHEYYPQERVFLFFWDNIKLDSKQSRDWYLSTFDRTSNHYQESFHESAKDAWGVIHWYTPFFTTLEAAKDFIQCYKQYLQKIEEDKNPPVTIHNLD